MKSGLTIVEMAQQIERQSKLKQDYLLDTRRLQNNTAVLFRKSHVRQKALLYF